MMRALSTRIGFFLALLVAATVLATAYAQPTRPLTVEGKRALYQRVIAVPGAVLLDAPGASRAYAQPVTPFTVFYVYGRESTEDGRAYVQVGIDSAGRTDGWLPVEQAIDWQQTLTIGFRDPAEHPRVLLFHDRDALRELIDTNDAAAYQALREQALSGRGPEGSPVAAIQPEEFIDIRRNFYLVPILNHEDVLIGPHQGRLLRVASVPLRDPAEDPYRAGIVFVIDTTQSMRPYIDRTRDIMRDVYAQIEEAGLSDKVAYGLIGFRDSTEAVPALGYETRVFANLTGSSEEFLSQVATVDASNVSSLGFNEDPYAGVLQAIESINWADYFARYIILITDAGPRLGDDPLSSTGLDTRDITARLADMGIAAWTIHLKTEIGRDDHAFAEREYRALSSVPDIGSFYYPVEAGDVDDFGAALSAMMRQLTAQVAAAARGFQPLQSTPDLNENGELSEFQRMVARLGYALRMDYLQQTGEGSAPALFDAWMIDRDLTDPAERAIDVRVLLTRDQLSDLHDVLRRVVERAEEGAIAPQNFLDELRSLAAIISRDPEAVEAAVGGGMSLAELGYMREYIEGLPYHSEVMNLDLSDWQQWSAQQQFEFITQLDGKVAYYRALHDNVDLWVSLDGGPVDGDSVHPLLLEALP